MFSGADIHGDAKVWFLACRSLNRTFSGLDLMSYSTKEHVLFVCASNSAYGALKLSPNCAILQCPDGWINIYCFDIAFNMFLIQGSEKYGGKWALILKL